MNIPNDVIVNKTSAGFRNFGYFWPISFFEFLSMSGQNSSIHPFIWCITIKPVALCIIRNTWSVTALRSLHTIVSEEGDHQACEKEEILKKIMHIPMRSAYPVLTLINTMSTLFIVKQSDKEEFDWLVSPGPKCHSERTRTHKKILRSQPQEQQQQQVPHT